MGSYSSLDRLLDIMKSAVDLLQATGMLYSTDILSNAFISTSCGWDVIGSHRNINISSSPLAIIAPSCWSPPRGPLFSLWIFIEHASDMILPVVPVAYNSCLDNTSALYSTQLNKSFFRWSWATKAILFDSLFLFHVTIPFLSHWPQQIQARSGVRGLISVMCFPNRWHSRHLIGGCSRCWRNPSAKANHWRGSLQLKHGMHNVKQKGRITLCYWGVGLNVAVPKGEFYL